MIFLTSLLSMFSCIVLAEPKVLMQTNMGDIELELDSKNAPITTKNFLDYVNDKFYDGLTIHRVVSNFMIQGGGADRELNFKKPNEPIKNEANNGLKNDRGTIAMARTSAIDSATCQFFINLVNNNYLNYQSPENYGYAVFGKVTKGMDVVDHIASVQTTRKGPHPNVPVEPIYIIKMTIIDEPPLENQPESVQ